MYWNYNLVDDSDIFTVDTDHKYFISHCPIWVPAEFNSGDGYVEIAGIGVMDSTNSAKL